MTYLSTQTLSTHPECTRQADLRETGAVQQHFALKEMSSPLSLTLRNSHSIKPEEQVRHFSEQGTCEHSRCWNTRNEGNCWAAGIIIWNRMWNRITHTVARVSCTSPLQFKKDQSRKGNPGSRARSKVQRCVQGIAGLSQSVDFI